VDLPDPAPRVVELVNPANRRKLTSSSSAPAWPAAPAAAATLGEAGYNVKSFCYQDSPRRAHSIAAQGGINAAKNYKEDGDSTYRLFYDTVKGGDYRARETNVYRLAEVSANIIDQCVAQGVPFAREYGGLLDNRSFGGVQVSRTFYARGQTGQQLLIGAYQALERQVAKPAPSRCSPARDARAHRRRRARPRHHRPRHGHRRDRDPPRRRGRPRLRRLRQRLLPVHQRHGLQRHRDLAGAPQGRLLRQPLLHADPPDLHPGVRRPPVQAHPDVRVAAQRRPDLGAQARRGLRQGPAQIPEEDRDYYLERIYPAFGNLVPRDIASRQAKNMCDEGRGVGPMVGDFRRGVYLDFADAIKRMGRAVEEKYGNLFDMYARITGENPYETPMRIYPAVHYTMGGLWVDYDLQSTIPGLFVTGEANFSDHGANRLGASALMQGLADGYFVLPNTIRDYLAKGPFPKVDEDAPGGRRGPRRVEERIDKRFLAINGERTVDSFHKELGHIMWEYCGMERTEEGLLKAIDLIRELRAEFWRNVGSSASRPTRSTRAWRRPAAWPTSSSSASSCASTRCTAASPAVATSARSPRPRTARRCATTTSSSTSRRGSSATASDPNQRRWAPVLHKEDLVYEVHRAEAAELQVNARHLTRPSSVQSE
jgi:succinate dehydrogenase / fumarate reductase flavoprotein subunit